MQRIVRSKRETEITDDTVVIDRFCGGAYHYGQFSVPTPDNSVAGPIIKMTLLSI